MCVGQRDAEERCLQMSLCEGARTQELYIRLDVIIPVVRGTVSCQAGLCFGIIVNSPSLLIREPAHKQFSKGFEAQPSKPFVSFQGYFGHYMMAAVSPETGSVIETEFSAQRLKFRVEGPQNPLKPTPPSPQNPRTLTPTPRTPAGGAPSHSPLLCSLRRNLLYPGYTAIIPCPCSNNLVSFLTRAQLRHIRLCSA